MLSIKKCVVVFTVFSAIFNFNCDVFAYDFSILKTKETLIQQNSKSVFLALKDTELLDAISLKDIEKAKNIILTKKEQINLVDCNGRGPLHYAARIGNLELVTMLIEKGAQIDLKDQFSQTPLMYSINNEVSDFLIAHGANLEFAEVNRKAPDGKSSLLKAAVIQNSIQDVNTLLSHGAYVDIIDQFGKTPLFFCRSTEVASILIKYGANVNAIDFCCKTVFESAIESNNIELLDFLIIQNGGPENLSFVSSIGIIFSSITYQNLKIFSHVCDDFGLVCWNNTKFNMDLLSYAVEHRSYKIIDYIFSKGIDVNLFNSAGDTLLHVAIRNSDFYSIMKFIDRGAKMNNPNILGAPPISEVRSLNFFDSLVKLGLAQEKDIEATDLVQSVKQ